MTRRVLGVVAAAGLMSGCYVYTETGRGVSLDAQTYISTTWEPKTVQLIDTRTGEVMWEYELAVGKQLTVRFYADKEPSNTYTPDLMRWEVWDEPTSGGKLTNTMLVPPSSARRIEWFLRDTPEMPPAEG